MVLNGEIPRSRTSSLSLEMRYLVGSKYRSALFAILAYFSIWLAGCSLVQLELSTPPPAPCPMEGLILNEASFPSGDWQQLGSPRPRGAPSSVGVEKLGTSFTAEQGEVAVMGVYRFSTEKTAERSFHDLGQTWFRESPHETTWFVPEQINVNPTADRYRLACNYDTALEVHQCRFFAQYGVYLIELSLRTRESSEDMFSIIVDQIDARFAECRASIPK